MCNRPMIQSIITNNPRKLYSLLESGEDPNFHDPLGLTPLQWAKKLGFMRCISLLTKSGCRYKNYIEKLEKDYQLV